MKKWTSLLAALMLIFALATGVQAERSRKCSKQCSNSVAEWGASRIWRASAGTR